MTLKEMMKMTTHEAVLEELMAAYPECLSNKNDYLNVLKFIDHTPAVYFDDFIVSINIVDPSDDEDYEEDIDEEAYLSISGYSLKEDLHFALGFTRWEEWSNAQLVIQEDLEINPDELIAICIYEMTFYGFDQDEIAKEFNEFEKGVMLH